MSDQHAVFVTFEDGTKSRVSYVNDWTEAIDMWHALDDQRREVRKNKGLLMRDGKIIRHYEVRSVNDPAYQHLPYIDLALGFEVWSREYTTDIAAAKAVLKPLHYYAKPGGWVYYNYAGTQPERTVAQGWWAAAKRTGHPVDRLAGEQGYRAVVTRSLQVKVERS